MAAPIYYQVYLNTMIFTVISGVISLVLLLALMYVPSMSQYSILILTVQIGLILVILQALYRIWWSLRKTSNAMDMSNRNTLAVGFCPDYMRASVLDSSSGGGTTCSNLYPGGQTQIWTGLMASATPAAPTTVSLALLDGKNIKDVCAAANSSTSSSMLSQPTAAVPWTELRSRCSTFMY